MTRAQRTFAICAAVAALQAAAVVVWLRGGTGAAARVSSAPSYERAATRGLAPDLVVRTAGGADRLSNKRGRPVLLHFWATWCPPCHEELPDLLAYARGGGVDVMAVSVDESFAVLEHYFDGALPAEVSRVDHEEAKLRYGAAALPRTLLVDAQGVLRGTFQGAQRWRASEMQRLLDAELERRDPP